MDKYIFDEGNGLWYELIGDYYFPCLTVPTEEEQPVGIWGQRHKRYIKEYHPALYNALLLNGRLNSYLADIDQQAQERLDTIIEQMARSQGITEALKAADQMTWVGKMNTWRATPACWWCWTRKTTPWPARSRRPRFCGTAWWWTTPARCALYGRSRKSWRPAWARSWSTAPSPCPRAPNPANTAAKNVKKIVLFCIVFL